jgi:uncharacterized protein (DUF952 family)
MVPLTDRIYHWCPDQDWVSTVDEYHAPSLEHEGFIHCSFRHQVAHTASTWDRGTAGLVLLSIDPGGLPVVVEDLYQIGERFPHVYAPIPVSSVIAVFPFEPERDGSFRFPGEPLG